MVMFLYMEVKNSIPRDIRFPYNTQTGHISFINLGLLSSRRILRYVLYNLTTRQSDPTKLILKVHYVQLRQMKPLTTASPN